MKLQSEKILERAKKFKKLYLEFGGKLFDDYHMSRCVPGFEPDIKIKMLLSLREKCEVILCINAEDIEQGKMRYDTGLTYENELIRLADNFKEVGLAVVGVVINKFAGQQSSEGFAKKLEGLGIKSYFFNKIDDYPANVEQILSDNGFGSNPCIKTSKPIVIITGSGAKSGKLSVALSQLYNEMRNGVKTGYAKFETLPVWNLRLKHPLNLAYEASTVDVADVNMIDNYHYEKYGEVAVNYNRDIEAFPLLTNIFNKIYKKTVYHSPTDMGVNMVGFCIEDNATCEVACRAEVLRRYYQTMCNYRIGKVSEDAVHKIKILVEQMNIKTSERPVVTAALELQQKTGKNCVAIQFKNGKVVASGKIYAAPANGMTSAASEAILKTLQGLLDVNENIKLIPDNIMQMTIALKQNTLGEKKFHLQIGEVLVILSASSVTSELSRAAIDKLKYLEGAEAHSTYIMSDEEQKIFKRLKINLTQEAILN